MASSKGDDLSDSQVVLEVPDGHFGRCTYSSFSHQSDAFAYFAEDPRWVSRLVVSRVNGRVMGSLAVHYQSFPTYGDATTTAARAFLTEESAEAAHQLLYCVSPQRLIGGAAARAHRDRETTEGVLASVFGAAAAFARANALRPIALFTPGEQLGAIYVAWPGASRPVLADFDHYLNIPRKATFESFIESLPPQQRQTWNQDSNRLAEEAIKVQVEPLDDQILTEMYPLIASVQANNGQALTPELTKLRTQRWLSAEPGERHVFTVREGGHLVAGAIARVVENSLQVREIGLVSSHPSRHDLYIAITYYFPTIWAIKRGLRKIEFGRSHGYPKVARGSRQIPLWHVGGADPNQP